MYKAVEPPSYTKLLGCLKRNTIISPAKVISFLALFIYIHNIQAAYKANKNWWQSRISMKLKPRYEREERQGGKGDNRIQLEGIDFWQTTGAIININHPLCCRVAVHQLSFYQLSTVTSNTLQEPFCGCTHTSNYIGLSTKEAPNKLLHGEPHAHVSNCF